MVHVVLDDEFIGNVFWNGLGLFGTTKDLQALTSLKDWLRSVRLPHVRIRYVGGLSVILVFEDKEGMLDFLSTKEVWNLVFSTLVLWEGQMLPCDRIAWLKIFGLPLCMFDSSVVDKIGSSFGRVVQSAQVNEDLEDYSYAMVGVLCNSMKRFNQVCNLKWRNEVISILVEEELGEWIPDCIGMDGEESLVDLMPGKMTVDSHIDTECSNEEVADVGPHDVVDDVMVLNHAQNVDQEEVAAQNPDPLKVDGLGFSMLEVVECSGSKKKKRGSFRKKTRFDKNLLLRRALNALRNGLGKVMIHMTLIGLYSRYKMLS
ncbi:hypothetical protein Hdeb2414_s0020g00561771 [Helianthus debilis subsp. tardiflorus]